MLQIVIIEDNPAESHLLSRSLKDTGIPLKVQILDDGLKAIDYLAGHPRECDLVLLDLNLSRTTGFEVLARLKSHPQSKAVPVVVLSGSADPADVDRCYRDGASAYVCKPMHLDAFATMAHQLLTYWCHCVVLPDKRADSKEGRARQAASCPPG